MLHEEGTQLVFFRLRPNCSRNFLAGRFRAVTFHDFCRVAGGLPKEQLHVRFPVSLGDLGETADYEDRELLELLRSSAHTRWNRFFSPARRVHFRGPLRPDTRMQ